MTATLSARRVLLALAALFVLALVWVSLALAPSAAGFQGGEATQRIFYYHVPSAWVAYLAFAVTAAASARHLVSRDAGSDRLAAASAEIGLLFAVIALATGLLWARVAFAGTYRPIEDAKVLTLVVLILAYAGYLALRRSIDERDRRGRLAAVYGLFALAGVPLSYLASKVSVHPDFSAPGSSLGPELGALLGFAVLAFTVLYAALLFERVALAETEARLGALA